MISQIPLYSRGRPLKNLIADWQKRTGLQRIMVEDPTNLLNPTELDLITEHQDLYKAVIEKYYFSDIGFDTDDEFIYRFNAIFNSNKQRYGYLIETIYNNGYSFEKEASSNETHRRGSDTNQKSGSDSTSDTHSGEDETQKGVTTTSTSETSNTGDKLARSTPNEKLSVVGEGTTTVTDSGSDKVKYGHHIESEVNYNSQTEQTYNSDLTANFSKSKEKLTPEDIAKLYAVKSIFEEFALCFNKLFMGVL